MNAEYGDNVGFWHHEYNAHCICDNGTVASFFNKVLDVYMRTNFGLQLGTIVQNEYHLLQTTVKQQVLHSRLMGVIHRRFAMMCTYDFVTGYYKLKELRLQFAEIGNQLVMVNLLKMPFWG
ncbi:hypothetical protein MKX03_019090, partial [Papaver bracteatum]